MHGVFCALLTSPQTSPVFTVLFLEPFLEPQMYMNSAYLIFLLASLENRANCYQIYKLQTIFDGQKKHENPYQTKYDLANQSINAGKSIQVDSLKSLKSLFFTV